MDNLYYDSMNRPRTESLFLETFRQDLKGDYKPVYTMRPFDHKGCKSAYQIYMNADTEYDAAMQIVGDMRHWRRLCRLKWFMKGSDDGLFDGLETWRKDKAEKDATDVIRMIKKKAEAGNVPAQRTLLDTAKEVSKARVGRPEKQKDLSPEEERDQKIVALHKEIKQKKET